jgi:uncharacterized protein with HEPN domain
LNATAGKTFEDFEADWMLRFAVERATENISEAVRQIPDEKLNLQPDIPWPLIKGIGNVLRHEYHRIAPKTIWNVVTQQLRPLQMAMKELQKSQQKPRSRRRSRYAI